MHLAPVFQRKLVNMSPRMANPIWVADQDLGPDYHIIRGQAPSRVTARSSMKLVGRLHPELLLDRSRPLWSSI
jgi:hypothetical protein